MKRAVLYVLMVFILAASLWAEECTPKNEVKNLEHQASGLYSTTSDGPMADRLHENTAVASRIDAIFVENLFFYPVCRLQFLSAGRVVAQVPIAQMASEEEAPEKQPLPVGRNDLKLLVGFTIFQVGAKAEGKVAIKWSEVMDFSAAKVLPPDRLLTFPLGNPKRVPKSIFAWLVVDGKLRQVRQVKISSEPLRRGAREPDVWLVPVKW